MGKPELLAPAGSQEALVAAVQNGADAVYLGGRAFNARQSAANFDSAELARAVEYAHVRGVKVYVTVNTLVADGELEAAARFLDFLSRTGADAAILQDLGLAALAREVAPELPLHASTQMTVHNSPAVAHLRRLGFQRVILARGGGVYPRRLVCLLLRAVPFLQPRKHGEEAWGRSFCFP